MRYVALKTKDGGSITIAVISHEQKDGIDYYLKVDIDAAVSTLYKVVDGVLEKSTNHQTTNINRAIEEAEVPKGLLVHVLAGVDESYEGPTMRVLVGEGIPEIFNACSEAPAIRLKESLNGYLCVEPVEPVPEGQIGYMADGRFVYSTDSRFRKISEYPLSLHDRTESPEQYDALSR